MLDNILKEDCCGCSACAQACPNSCINMILDEEGFWYPIIDKKKCINCKKCENVCPTKKIVKKEKGQFTYHMHWMMELDFKVHQEGCLD